MSRAFVFSELIRTKIYLLQAQRHISISPTCLIERFELLARGAAIIAHKLVYSTDFRGFWHRGRLARVVRWNLPFALGTGKALTMGLISIGNRGPK
jgi:hypothetical protein